MNKKLGNTMKVVGFESGKLEKIRNTQKKIMQIALCGQTKGKYPDAVAQDRILISWLN